MMKLLKTAAAIIALFLILFIGGRIINSQIEQGNWIDDHGRLNYPDRGAVEFTKERVRDEATHTLEKIVYKSKGTNVYAHLYKPKKEGNVPAVIILPAAQAPKEGQAELAGWLAEKGYATLVPDQRGIGETKWAPKDAQAEFDEFMQNKKETTEQLMAYDALRAFDLMLQTEGIDTEKIMLEGESMGGRFAMIATALEPRINGAVIISSSGYGTTAGDFKIYLDTINPDNYVNLISPRKLVMFHSETDPVVPTEQAMQTFSLAKEPKEFITMPATCKHGFCDEIREQLLEKLEEIRNS